MIMRLFTGKGAEFVEPTVPSQMILQRNNKHLEGYAGGLRYSSTTLALMMLLPL